MLWHQVSTGDMYKSTEMKKVLQVSETEIKKIMENNELTPFQKLIRVKHMSVSNTRRIKALNQLES